MGLSLKAWRRALDRQISRVTGRRSGTESPRTLGSRDSNSAQAIVIGAGMGGLAAAIRLAARGYQVTVLERLNQAGGRARVFRHEGFVFDAGPSVITAPFLFEELFKLCGKKLEDDLRMLPVFPFYRVLFSDGSRFNYSGDMDAMREEIGRFSADDFKGFERFLERSREIYEVGFSDLAHVPLSGVWRLAKSIPALLNLQNTRSYHELVSKYISNEKLRAVFSFHSLLVGGNPFTTSSIYALITHLEHEWGVWFVEGGTGELVRALVGLIEGLGSRIELGVEVDRILVEEGRVTGVRLGDGKKLKADIVVSNADSGWTYRHLIDSVHRPSWTNDKIDEARYSTGLFVWYFGTDIRYENVAHHTVILGKEYEELFQETFEHRSLTENLVLYLHRPTATDSNMAPEGHDTFYVLSPVPHLDAGIDWSQRSESYREGIMARLSQTLLPGLEEHIVFSKTMAPDLFFDDYLSLKGSAFGLEPLLEKATYFRPRNKSRDIEGLYLVGAGTHPGAGLPGVLSSAKVLDSLVPDPAVAIAERIR